MPFNESRRDLPPECDEAESSSVRGYRGPHCPSGHRPRHVLARQKNQMLEVDVTEEAKQVALYRYELSGELYDDDEILNFFYNDITELEQEERDEITFEFWLEEMISFTKSDDTLTGGTRQRWPKCGTGQPDRAMSGSRLGWSCPTPTQPPSAEIPDWRADRRLCGSSLPAGLVGPERYRGGCDS